MAWRAEKLNREIAKQLADILNKHEWPAERVTVASAEISAKFDYVRVYVGVWPVEAEQKTIEELNRQKGLIKKELAGKLKMRLMPEIGFYTDRSSEAASRIADLLKEVEKDLE